MIRRVRSHRPHHRARAAHRALLAVVAAVAGVTAPAEALADPARTTWASSPANGENLDVALGVGTEECPDADFVRSRFVESLSASSSHRLPRDARIAIEREDDGYVAHVTIQDRVRTLRSPDCDELANSAAWIAAFSIAGRSDRDATSPEHDSSPSTALASNAPSPTPRVSTNPREAPHARETPPVSDRSAPSSARGWARAVHIAASALFGDNYVPGVWPGVAVGAAYRGPWWSIGGEARVYPRKGNAQSWSSGHGTIFTTAALASSVACLRWMPVQVFGIEGCSTFAVGAHIAALDVQPGSDVVRPAVYIGGRAGFELRPAPLVAFGASTTIEGAPVSREIVFVTDGENVSIWNDSLVAGALSFEMRALF